MTHRWGTDPRARFVCAFWSAIVFLYAPASAFGAVTARLSEPRVMPLQGRFEVDLQLEFSADWVGGEIEFLNLDVVNSNVNGTPIDLFNVIEFEARLPFDSWQIESRFGANPGVFRSQMLLDSFAGATSTPFLITDTEPVKVGTFTMNYVSLAALPGDDVTLDVIGVDDGSPTKTTSLAMVAPGASVPSFVDPVFEPGARTVTVVAVPEPSVIAVVAVACAALLCRRRRAIPGDEIETHRIKR